MTIEQKCVWIVHQDASTPETGYGGRHFYLPQELAKQGYKVYVIASSYHHLLRSPPTVTDDFTFESVSGVTFVWVKMPHYIEAHSKQRALNWFLFPWRIQKLARLIEDKPDAILCSSPSLVAFLGAQRLAKRFTSKLIFEVRDIWPLTLMEIGSYSSRHPFIRFMQWVEKKAYVESDQVVSNLKNSVEHMIEHGLKKDNFTWIPNGFSLDEVNQKIPLNPIAKQKLPKNNFIIGYTGTIGVANSLDTLLETAKLLLKETNISFVLVGDGKEKENLQAFVRQEQLSNVTFIDSIPKVQIQSMLNTFDACYIGWLKSDIYRFGIGANKIPEYLYAGKPIIHGYSGACDPVTQFQAGITVEAENPKALADGILKLYQSSIEQREEMGINGRKSALDHYEYAVLAKNLARILFEK